MRPNEFYALPNVDTRPWYDAHGKVERFFDDPSLEWNLDDRAAKEAGADALAFERKLFANVDGERTVSYVAVTFEGRPVGILVTAGRGEQDQEHRIVTDADGYAAARGYLDRYVKEPPRLASDLADPDAQIEVLDGIYGHVVIVHDGETRLLDVDHVSDLGTVLFDEKAYDLAFDRIVRPAFAGPDTEGEMRKGISGERMQGLVTRAVLESMPAGVEATDEFGDIPEVEGIRRYQDWSPVLVAGDDGTYTVGVDSMPAWFTFRLKLERVGPPELYAELAAKSVPSP